MGKVDLQIILTMKMSEKKFIFQVYTIQRYFLVIVSKKMMGMVEYQWPFNAEKYFFKALLGYL